MPLKLKQNQVQVDKDISHCHAPIPDQYSPQESLPTPMTRLPLI
jgi:hypothetical protein